MAIQPPQGPPRVLPYTGIAAVAVLWVTIGLGMVRGDLGIADGRPISYLGTHPRAMPLFQGGLVVAAMLLVAFACLVQRRLDRPAAFVALFVTAMAAQGVVAVVPLDGAPPSPTVHTAAGLLLAACLPLFIWRFAARQHGPERTRAYRLLWLDVAASLAGVALSRAGLAVLAEAVPAGAFHLWVIVVSLPTLRAGSGERRAPVLIGR